MEPVSAVAIAAVVLASRSGAEELGKEAGHSVWGGLSRLAALVRTKFRGDDHALQALRQAQDDPRDLGAISRLETALAYHSERDQLFAAELQRLTGDARNRQEYQQGSALFANYGWAGKVTVFQAPVQLEHGDFNIN